MDKQSQKKNVGTWRRIKYTNIIVQFFRGEELDSDIYIENVYMHARYMMRTSLVAVQFVWTTISLVSTVKTRKVRPTEILKQLLVFYTKAKKGR